MYIIYINNYNLIVFLLLTLSLFIYYNLAENYCIDTHLCLKNMSLSSRNYKPFSCSNSYSLAIPFHANRNWNNKPNYIVTTLYIYPSKNKFYKYINFIESFSKSNNGKILLLVSFNLSLYKLIYSTKYITEMVYNNKMLKYIHYLDNGYFLFKYKNSNSYCYLFYTNIIQNYFSNEFLNHFHYTEGNKKYKFSGYYAAGTNLYSVIPYMLSIFDYFDYYFKYDFDKPGIININEFAFRNIQPKKWYLFGTCLRLDASFVCQNIKEMILEFVKMKNCSKNIVSAANLLTNDCIEFPGWFTGMWLGLYTSIEMKDFSNFYISYKKGIALNRWGDQQFFVNSLLLFGGRNNINYNLTYNCVIENN